MKKIKHKLVIVTTSAFIAACDAIIKSNLAARQAVGGAIKIVSRRLGNKKYLKA